MKRIIQNLHKLPPQPASMAAALITAAMLATVVTLLPAVARAQADEESVAVKESVADEAEGLGNQYCPVLTDELVDPTISVEYEGRTVYFCCQRCRKKFLANPEEYVANLPSPSGGQDLGHVDASGGHDEAEESGVGHTEAHDHGGDHGHDEDAAAGAEEPVPDSGAGQDPGVSPAGGEHGEAHEAGAARTEAHDHRTDHGQSDDDPVGALEYLGRFHPLVVHFPIGLLIFAFVLEMVGLIRSGEALRLGARYAVAGAALAALAAAALGWLAGSQDSFPGLAATLTWHRWAGTLTALLACATLIASELYHRRGAGFRPLYLVLLTTAALLVGLTGHLGASLIYGPDYLSL